MSPLLETSEFPLGRSRGCVGAPGHTHMEVLVDAVPPRQGRCCGVGVRDGFGRVAWRAGKPFGLATVP